MTNDDILWSIFHWHIYHLCPPILINQWFAESCAEGAGNIVAPSSFVCIISVSVSFIGCLLLSSVLETIDTLFLWERSAGTHGQTRAGDIEHSWSHFSSSAPILLNIGNPRVRDQPQLSQNHHSLWMLPWERCGAGTAMLSKDTAVTHKLHSQHKNENVWFFQSDFLPLISFHHHNLRVPW